MLIKTEGIAKLRSKTTKEIFKVTPGDLDWQGAGGDEKGMGGECLNSATVEFMGRDGELVSCEWTVTDYPADSLNHVTEYTRNAELLENFSFSKLHVTDDD